MIKSVKCIPYPGIENAYIVISARKSDTGNGCQKNMSFFWASKDIGIEWEPDYGPITIIYKCDKDHKDAEPHWFYDYYTGQGNWSQLAVKREYLPKAFISGDYEHIFRVLKEWAKNN